MAQFSVHDAKTNLSRLIADALAGGDVVIARGSVPVVRLVPVEPRGRRCFGILRDKIAPKYRIGKLPHAALLAHDFEAVIVAQGFDQLAFSVHHARLAGEMKIRHKDSIDC